MTIQNHSAINQSLPVHTQPYLYRSEAQRQQEQDHFFPSNHSDFIFTNSPFLGLSAIDNYNIKDFQQSFPQFTSYQHSATRNSQFNHTSGRSSSSSSDLNSLPSEKPQFQHSQMNHRHSISISSEQSAIETSNSQDPNNVVPLSSTGGGNFSIVEGDLNLSPTLANGPFELDPTLWSAAAASSSMQINNINNSTDLNTSPGYRYRTEVANNTSPTFTAGNERQGSQFNDFNLNSFQNQPLPLSIETNSNLRRLSENIWNHDQHPALQQQNQPHSRQSSFGNSEMGSNNQYSYTNSNEASPVWAQFNVNNDWRSKPLPPLQQPPNYRNIYYNAIDDFSASAAQRRHSYAAVGDNQWASEGFGGMGLEGGYFNNQRQQPQYQYQQQSQQFQQPLSQLQQLNSGLGGHIQRLSADFGNLGLNSGENIDELEIRQPHESSVVFRSSYKSVDYYFTNDEFNRVHITDASTADLPSTLDALSKKGAQLPKFPGNSLPGAKLVLVAFKAGRVDVFYSPENSNMILNIGDLVLVEADRGQDLGKIVRLDVSIDEARLLKLRQHQEQQLALADNEQLGFISGNVSGQQQAVPSLHFPKPIIKFAEPQQVSQVPNKQADEEKARRVCSLKVRAHGLVMQVVDLEYQWDRRKLTFYYAANQRIDFRELVKELFRIYKTRIWMCAVSGGLNAIKEQQQKLNADINLGQFNVNNNLTAGPYNLHLNITNLSSNENNQKINNDNNNNNINNINDNNEFNRIDSNNLERLQ